MGPLYGIQIAKHLAESAEVLCVVSRQAYNIEDWRSAGLELFEMDTFSSPIQFLLNTLDVTRFARLRAVLKAFSPDVVYHPMLHVWGPLVNLLAVGAAKLVTIHDPVLHQGEQNPLIELVQRVALRQSSRAIVLSKQFVNTLVGKGFDRRRIDVVPLGEFTYFDALADVVNEEPLNPPSLLFFGRILPYKGLDILLHAWPLIRARVPDASLAIVGQGDLNAYRGALDVTDSIRIVNHWISDREIAPFFRAARIIVLPYRGATQSSIVPVAYGFKKPVVATNVGGIVEQVIDGQTGLLVPPANPQALAAACIRLLLDREEAECMGRAGWEYATTEWSWSSIGQRIAASCRAARPELAAAQA